MRDDVTKHVWDFSPEVSMPKMKFRNTLNEQSSGKKLNSVDVRDKVCTGGTIRRIVVIRPKCKVCNEGKEKPSRSIHINESFR